VFEIALLIELPINLQATIYTFDCPNKKVKMKSRIFAFFLFASMNVFGQQGLFDTTFAGNGIFIDSAKPTLAYIFDVAEVPGNGLFVAGSQNRSASITKLKHNGTIDSSFGVNGIWLPIGITNNVNNSSFCYNIKALSNGTLLAASTKTNVASDTIFLTNFDTSGTVIHQTFFDYHQDEFTIEILQQNNQRILVAAKTGNRIRLFAYNTALAKDLSFGGIGYVQSPTPQVNWNGFDVTIDNLDRPIIAMHINGQVTISRFTANGIPDSSFGGVGFVQLNPDLFTKVNSVTARPDNGIYVIGQGLNAPQNEKRLILLADSGSVINNFGANGDAKFSCQNVADAFLQQDEKLVVVANHSFKVLRFFTNGVFDTTFSQMGILDTNLAKTCYATAGLMQSDGKIVVVGVTLFGNSTNIQKTSAIRLITGIPISIQENPIIVPNVLFYPNPFSKHATLKFSLQQDAKLTISLINMLGVNAADLATEEAFLAGENEISIDGFGGLPTGQYFVVITAADSRVSIPIIKTE
jgi:hypothetical protein